MRFILTLAITIFLLFFESISRCVFKWFCYFFYFWRYVGCIYRLFDQSWMLMSFWLNNRVVWWDLRRLWLFRLKVMFSPVLLIMILILILWYKWVAFVVEYNGIKIFVYLLFQHLKLRAVLLFLFCWSIFYKQTPGFR